MKKFLAVAMGAALCLTATACSNDFEWDESVRKMQKNGFTVEQRYETESELQEATQTFNTEIALEGGEFTVEIEGFVSFIKGEARCQFIEFDEEWQARDYYNLYLDTRRETNDYEVARFEEVVVLANSKEAREIVGGRFK